MSESTDDIHRNRMDRAQRIRQLREERINDAATSDAPDDQPSAPATDADSDTAEQSSAAITDAQSTATDAASDDTASMEESPERSPDEQAATEVMRALEIELGEERYAFDVTYVDEIVEQRDITRVPNTPDCVAGVIDLRGRVTTVIDPTVVLDPPGEPAADRLIVVFDSDRTDQQATVGWLVDDVHRVTGVDKAAVTDPPEQYEWMEGLIESKDQDGYVVLIAPELVFDRARSIIEQAINA